MGAKSKFNIIYWWYFGLKNEIGQIGGNTTGDIVYNPMGLNRAF